MKKLLTLGMILGLAACAGEDDTELDEMDTDMEVQEPAPTPMMQDTAMMDTMMMDTMMMDTMENDTMGGM